MIKYIFIFIFLIIITIIIINNNTNIEQFTDKPTRYIFWTGGFDSTYCVLEAIYKYNHNVVPIYLSGVIDNDINKSTRRKNIQHELNSIKKITSLVYKQRNKYSKLLKPLVIVPKLTLNNDVKNGMDILYRKQMVRRPICQYAYLSQVTLDMNRPIELAVEYEPKSSMMYNAIYKYVDGDDYMRKINKKYIQLYPELNIYRHFRFTTLHLSKHDMLKQSIKYGFDKYLYLTWSCWYPQNGKPCNRCIMCKERII